MQLCFIKQPAWLLSWLLARLPACLISPVLPCPRQAHLGTWPQRREQSTDLLRGLCLWTWEAEVNLGQGLSVILGEAACPDKGRTKERPSRSHGKEELRAGKCLLNSASCSSAHSPSLQPYFFHFRLHLCRVHSFLSPTNSAHHEC